MKKVKLLSVLGFLLIASFFSDITKVSFANIADPCRMCEWDESMMAYCMPRPTGWKYCQALNGKQGGSCNMSEYCQ